MANRSVASPKITMQMSATIQNTMFDGQVATGQLAASTADTLTSGGEVDQVNRGWQWKNKTLLDGNFIVIDLYDVAARDMGAGLGVDIVGQALIMEEIVAIKIKNENASTAAGHLEIRPDNTNGWLPIGSHMVANGGALLGGGVLMKYQPAEAAFDVEDGVSHRIRLIADGGDITYSVYVLGRSDDAVSSSSSSSLSSSSLSSSSSFSITSSSSSLSSSSQSSSSSVTSSSSSVSITSSSSSTSSTSSSSSSITSSSSSFSITSSSSSFSITSSSSSTSSSSASSNIEPLWVGPAKSGVTPATVLGAYTQSGTTNGRYSYTNGTYFLWWDSATEDWNITDADGVIGVDAYWYQNSSGAGQSVDAALYGPQNYATGTIWVAVDHVGDSSSRSSSSASSTSSSSSQSTSSSSSVTSSSSQSQFPI